jgi:hypothetical protein
MNSAFASIIQRLQEILENHQGTRTLRTTTIQKAENRNTQFPVRQSTFSATTLNTKGWHFDRDEANAR